METSQSEAEIIDALTVDRVANDAKQRKIGNKSKLMNESVRERIG